MVKLYYAGMSPPSRSVLLLAKAIDLNLDLHLTNLMAGENFSEDFLKMNPQHCIPVIDDDGFYLSESGAINIYLVEKYAKDDSLYPKDIEKRATINQRMLFLSGVLWSRFFETYIIPVCFQSKGINYQGMVKLDDAFNTLDKYLDGHEWISGDDISVADYTYLPIIWSLEAVGYDVSKYENVSSWLTRAKDTVEDYEDLNQTGLEQFSGWILGKIKNYESQNK